MQPRSQCQHPRAADQPPGDRSLYRPPRLVFHGSLAELTAGVGNFPPGDADFPASVQAG